MKVPKDKPFEMAESENDDKLQSEIDKLMQSNVEVEDSSAVRREIAIKDLEKSDKKTKPIPSKVQSEGDSEFSRDDGIDNIVDHILDGDRIFKAAESPQKTEEEKAKASPEQVSSKKLMLNSCEDDLETILETDQESNYMTTNRTMVQQPASGSNDKSFTNMAEIATNVDFASKLQ